MRRKITYQGRSFCALNHRYLQERTNIFLYRLTSSYMTCSALTCQCIKGQELHVIHHVHRTTLTTCTIYEPSMGNVTFHKMSGCTVTLSRHWVSLWAKLIVPPTLAPGAKADHTSPWLVIVGDPGCPGIACQFLAGAEQSSSPFAPWLMIF